MIRRLGSHLGMALLLWVVAGFVISVVTIGIMLAGLAIGLVAGIPEFIRTALRFCSRRSPGFLALGSVLAVACAACCPDAERVRFGCGFACAGYWTRQPEVPAWRGQDDPMPFEIEAAR